MIVKEIRKIILDAVEEHFRTTDSIKKYFESRVQANILTDDLRHVLDGLTNNKTLVHLSNHAFSAYFPAGNLPVKFFRAGAGKVNAVYEGTNDGMPLLEISIDYTSDFSEKKEIRLFPYFKKEQLDLIEKLTIEKRSYKEIAKELNFDEELFFYRLKHDPETKAAVIRGQKQTYQSDAEKVIYSAAVAGIDEAGIAAQMKLETSKFVSLLGQHPDLQAAFNRGRDEFKKANEPEKPVYIVAPYEPTVVDLRPARILSRKRLCVCGNPLGARTKECRECYLKLKHPQPTKTTNANELSLQNQIIEIVNLKVLEQSELLKLAIETILSCPITAIKQQFYERVSDRVFQSSEAETEKGSASVAAS